jgi:tetratricopeptide (TPR) repeat protein
LQQVGFAESSDHGVQVPFMSRVTSLTSMPEAQLNRWIKRVALLFVIVLVAFVAIYAFDRFRMPAAPMVDRQLAAAEAAVQADPADIAARGRLADLYTVNKRYAEAITQYDAILETGKETPLAHFGRANAYKGMGELDKAAADFRVVVDLLKGGEMANVDPILSAAYFGLGQIALEQGKADEAVTNLEAAVRIKRSDADSLNALGAAYLQAGKPEKAIEAAKKAVAFVPLGWSEPYTTLAAAYGAVGNAPLAEWASAMAEFAGGEVEKAKTRLLAIVDGPAGLDAAIGLGVIHEAQNEPAAAAEWYRKALAIDPENAAAGLGYERVAGPESEASASPAPSAAGGNG